MARLKELRKVKKGTCIRFELPHAPLKVIGYVEENDPVLKTMVAYIFKENLTEGQIKLASDAMGTRFDALDYFIEHVPYINIVNINPIDTKRTPEELKSLIDIALDINNRSMFETYTEELNELIRNGKETVEE